MSHTIENPYHFKFHWLNDKGSTTSVFRKNGHFDGEYLTLEETQIPAAAIIEFATRENRTAMTVATGDEQEPVTLLLVQFSNSNQTQYLKEEIDILRSRAWAKSNQEELKKAGRAQDFRAEVCPECQAALILSDMPETPQLYCHFCDTLVTLDETIVPRNVERELRICEECGLYSKPQKFTIFYFYFLVVIYGFWHKSTWRCPACMRGEAWKMLFGNAMFLLGVPVAMVQLIRSYGGSAAGKPFKGLDAGNINARKGKLENALAKYQVILQEVPASAGLKYNIAMALLQQGNQEKAVGALEMALRDCSNYVPAYQQLRQLYTINGDQDKLKALDKMWSTETEAEQNISDQTGSGDAMELDFD